MAGTDRASEGNERILLNPPEAQPTDRQAVMDTIDSGWISPAGAALNQFE